MTRSSTGRGTARARRRCLRWCRSKRRDSSATRAGGWSGHCASPCVALATATHRVRSGDRGSVASRWWRFLAAYPPSQVRSRRTCKLRRHRAVLGSSCGEAIGHVGAAWICVGGQRKGDSGLCCKLARSSRHVDGRLKICWNVHTRESVHRNTFLVVIPLPARRRLTQAVLVESSTHIACRALPRRPSVQLLVDHPLELW